MKDKIVIRHRQRMKHHFVNTSKVLLYGYVNLSDAAKITYQVIDGFDWEDKATGESKGYAFPAAETIAEIRGISVRTVQRHIGELEAVGLLTRTRRKHKASVLYIEDASQIEIDRYLALFVDKTRSAKAPSEDDKPAGEASAGPGRGVEESSAKTFPMTTSQTPKTVPVIRNDISVASAEPAQTTKMSLDYKEEKEGKKKNVNVEKSIGNGAQSMQAILQAYTVNAPPKQSRGVHSDRKAKRDHLAQIMAETFHDSDSLGCYRRIADSVPEAVIHRIMAEVKETAQLGRVRTSSAAIFVSAIQRYARDHGIPLGFEKQPDSREINRPLAAGP